MNQDIEESMKHTNERYSANSSITFMK